MAAGVRYREERSRFLVAALLGTTRAAWSAE
jgi:hypothetical protein